MNAICLITFKPNKIWCDFLNSFKNYKIFIIIDDDTFDFTLLLSIYTNITFIKIENEKCKQMGYINVNMELKKLISGWDKALYYFGVENKIYDLVWLIEDDVYFYDEQSIIEIDKQYIAEDLLSNKYSENSDGNKNSWHWKSINIQQYSPPYYKGMMCAVRFSKKMFECINAYARLHKTLFFLEALFPTIAIKNNLNYTNPCEFLEIHWRHHFEERNITTQNLYHPIKNLNNHIHLRNLK